MVIGKRDDWAECRGQVVERGDNKVVHDEKQRVSRTFLMTSGRGEKGERE